MEQVLAVGSARSDAARNLTRHGLHRVRTAVELVIFAGRVELDVERLRLSFRRAPPRKKKTFCPYFQKTTISSRHNFSLATIGFYGQECAFHFWFHKTLADRASSQPCPTGRKEGLLVGMEEDSSAPIAVLLATIQLGGHGLIDLVSHAPHRLLHQTQGFRFSARRKTRSFLGHQNKETPHKFPNPQPTSDVTYILLRLTTFHEFDSRIFSIGLVEHRHSFCVESIASKRFR